MDTSKFTAEEDITYITGKTLQSIKNLLFREFKHPVII